MSEQEAFWQAEALRLRAALEAAERRANDMRLERDAARKRAAEVGNRAYTAERRAEEAEAALRDHGCDRGYPDDTNESPLCHPLRRPLATEEEAFGAVTGALSHEPVIEFEDELRYARPEEEK